MNTPRTSLDAHAVVALIATRGRFDLLRERAVPSIVAQTRTPDRLVVVVDHSTEELSDAALGALGTELQSICGTRMPVTVLRNRRTPRRAAAAWNTGIDQLHRDERFGRAADLLYVAVLDDDDAWAPTHVEACLESATSGDLNMVASGIIRHESPDGAGHPHSMPSRLDVRELFIRGQHIQGSNLFVRLDMLLLAGMFDENLPSCTDRDLCIRLADLPALRFGATGEHTVHHHADARPDRLSAPTSPAKLDGLTRLWQKHAPRFDQSARDEAAARAGELFGWRPPSPAKLPAIDVATPRAAEGSMGFVIGFVTDADLKPHVDGLLADALELQARSDVDGVLVVVVENGPLPGDGARPLHDLVERHRARGLDIELISIERQRQDWARGTLVDTPDPSAARMPIAVSRTVLNTYVARLAERRPGHVAWILDDDKRLSVTVRCGDATVERATPDIGALRELRARGVQVVIGPDTGAAPLPFTATLRMQLVDLAHHLAVWEGRPPHEPWLGATGADVAARSSLHDLHYDLSRHTDHLETPLPLSPPADGLTCSDAAEMISRRIDRLLAGEQVFRPLTLEAEALPADAATPSVQRGGSTIFFDPRHLLAYPQTIARLGDRHVRRSDMLVAMLMRDQMGLRIVMHAAAGVRHDRSSTKAAGPNDSTLHDDICGYALHRAAVDLMAARRPEDRRRPLLAWSAEELKRAERLVRKYTDERLAAFTLSAWRVSGLAEVARRRARAMASGDSPWSRGPSREALERIARELDRICSLFKPSAMMSHARSVRASFSATDVRNCFASMDGLISEYRASLPADVAVDASVAELREARARALLERAYGVKDLRLLGAGGEGVVFTDERRVFKVLDLLKRRENHDTPATLKALAARLEDPCHLYSLTRVDVRDETLLLTYPYEASSPYAGGHGADLLALLRECRSNGIVFRNMHPKNLRVTSTGLKLIDFGSDIRPFTDDGYRTMAERAWLTWRWPHRPDLDAVMRRALTDKTIPELDGFSRFWLALNEERPSATRIVASIVDPIILDSGAGSVLDHGCGKKAQSARRLAQAGLRTVGFDPGTEMPARWSVLGEPPPNLTLTCDRDVALAAGPFDAVLSSLVLCELGNDGEYERVLRELRSSVKSDGIVVITVCNPFATFGGPTALHRRRDLPEGVAYEDSFWYVENAETDAGRREFHRPLATIERDLLRHGLEVERRIASETVDTERFEPASDFLTLVCRPSPIRASLPPTSLVIKTCAMEAATIERQAAHLVRQLEGPRVFRERILAIDSRRDGFVRQHAPADMDELLRAAERLRSRGVIDRVLVGPDAGETSRGVMERWFDVDCPETHSVGGAPLATPLWAIERCVGDYVLQVDSDILVHRATGTDDYLAEMIDGIEGDPAAVTASLSVAHRSDAPFSAGGTGTPWRVEVRGCLIHKARLLAARPFANPLIDGRPSLSWHRAVDGAVRDGRIASLRGASCRTWFVHPPNELKCHLREWMLMLDLVERFPAPDAQVGKVDLAGGPLAWTPRNRAESFVFVITGRDVTPGRMARCLESVATQLRSDWGAVIIDDASASLSRDALRMAVAPWKDRVTLIQPRERRGQLANMTLAIRHVCSNPDSVVVTLDLDDALIGPKVLDRVADRHAEGAQVTVGSMLRTDKHAPYDVTLDSPRQARGGNVWQHLRTFRKHLFDAIPDHELRLGGEYVDIAVDWSFMLPIVEMAERKAWIREPLYLYEPSGMGKGSDRDDREAQIAAITARKPRRPRAAGDVLAPLEPERVAQGVWGPHGGILFVRHGERPSFAGLDSEQRDAVQLTANGREQAVALGRRLGDDIEVVSSPVLRAVQTAVAIAEHAAPTLREPRKFGSLVDFRIVDSRSYQLVKDRLGWKGLVSAWMDGSLAPGILIPCHALVRAAVRDVVAVSRDRDNPKVVAVTHDFVIMALLESLHGVRTTAVPYLGGVFIDSRTAASMAAEEDHR